MSLLTDASITDEQIIDVCGRISEILAHRNEPCRSWTVFIRWQDGSGQPWTMDYGTSDCDTYEEAVKQVFSFISGMPADWRVHTVWAARASDMVRMDGYRFNPTPQFQVH